MADILGGRLSLEDAFSGPLEKLVNGLIAAENKFKQFTNSLAGSNQKITNDTTKTYQQVDRIAQRFINQGNTVADSINKANDRVRQNQEKTIEGLTQKYMKLGMNIQQAYSKAQQDSNKIWNGDSSPKGSGGDQLKDFAQSFLQGGIGGIIGKLGIIGSGITAGIAVMKTLNNFMEQGFDILNKVSDGLLSPEGIKNAIEESMDFETGRMKLDLFYGSKDKGLKAYQDATVIAQKTYAGERDTVEISAKLGQLGITPSQKQLEKLVDVAGTRPEVQTDHIGLAVKEAVEGRIAMLQMYGINNRTLKSYYDSLKKSNPNEYKDFKGALNKEGSAGNPQKYFNLLTSYIEQSTMNNYAERYAETLKGKLERMSGVWENLKAEMMGIDVGSGTRKDGGAFKAVGKMVDDLKDLMEKKSTLESIEKIGNAFGSAFESLGNAFNKAVTPETIDKVASAIVKIGEAIANMINRFVDSGQLDKLLDKLPDLTTKAVGNEIINKTTDYKVYADLAQGDLLGAGDDWLKGKFDWFRNVTGMSKNGDLFIDYQDRLKAQEARNKNDAEWLNNKLGFNAHLYDKNNVFDSFGDWFETKIGGAISDTQINTAIDKNSNLSDNEKTQLKDVINKDDKSIYHIQIGKIEANNFDEIMKSIQEAAGNRK